MCITYILDEHGNPVQEHDVVNWLNWYAETANRIVARDEIDGVVISTIFLGVDHGCNGPELFETLVFGGEHSGAQIRYDTREHALKGHAEAVIIVMKKTL